MRKTVAFALLMIAATSLSGCYNHGRPGHDSDHHHGHDHDGNHDGDHHWN